MEKLILGINKYLFGRFFRKKYPAFRLVVLQSSIRSSNSYKFDIFYQKNMSSELSTLCDFYGSDKGELASDQNPYEWLSHTYTDFYEMIFGQFRERVKNVLECGIGTNNPNLPSSMGVNGKPGASLRVWRDYFPNANVVGIDIDSDILFSEERIVTFQVDQTSPSSIRNFLSDIGDRNFDIILDDGLHEYYAGICLFENTIDQLSVDGVYIIEDITESDLLKYVDYFSEHYESYYTRFVNLHRPGLPLGDNSVLMITRKIERQMTTSGL